MNYFDQDIPGCLAITSTTTATHCRVMATENVSEDEKQHTFLLKGLYCSTDIAAGIHIQLTFIIILNIFLSITAFLENSLILFALNKEFSLHPPSKLLLRNLAITDICVGLIVEPLYVTLLVTAVNEHWSTCRSLEVTVSTISSILCAVSLLTLIAISVDRLLSLLLGLRYRQVVTLARVRAVISCTWLTGILSGSMYFWNDSVAFTVAFSLITFSLTTSVFSYAKIFRKLRQQQFQVHAFPQGQANGRQATLNIARYKKSVSSVLWVQVSLITCYTPFVVVVTLMTYRGTLENKLGAIAFCVPATLTFLNSSLNPILYCWKIRSVRQAAKDMMKQLNCCKSD